MVLASNSVLTRTTDATIDSIILYVDDILDAYSLKRKYCG